MVFQVSPPMSSGAVGPLRVDQEPAVLQPTNIQSFGRVAPEDVVCRSLQEDGMIDKNLRVINDNLPDFPSINHQQKVFLDHILMKTRVKTVYQPFVAELSFSLKELFIYILNKHPEVQIRFYGSTIHYLMSLGPFLDNALDALKVSQYRNELKIPFLKAPSDLDVRFQFTHEPSTEDVWNLQNDIDEFFLAKLKNANSGLFRRLRVRISDLTKTLYDDRVEPMYPQNFAILGLSTNQEGEDFTNTFDLVLYGKPSAAMTADSVNLSLTKDSESKGFSYSFVPTGSESLWQVMTDKILRITRMDEKVMKEHSLQMRDFLLTLMKSRIKGSRGIDEEMENLAISSTMKDSNVLNDATISKFQKAILSNPKKGMILLLQATVFLFQHNKIEAIQPLWQSTLYAPFTGHTFLDIVKTSLVFKPYVTNDLFDWLSMYGLALISGQEPAKDGFSACWTTHNGVPHIQLGIGEGVIILPFDHNQVNKLIQRWNGMYQLEKTAIIPIISCLFSNLNETGFPLDIDLVNGAESCIKAYLKEFSGREFKKISQDVLHLTHDQMLQLIKRSKDLISAENEHHCVSELEVLLTENPSVPCWLLWMQVLANSSNPANKMICIEIWKKRPTTNECELLSPAIESVIDALAKDRMDLVFQLIESDGTLEFAEKYLPKDPKYHSQVLPWIAKRLSKPDNLDIGLNYIQSPLFHTLIEYSKDDAQMILSEVAAKGTKNEKKLIEFALNNLEATTEKKSLSAAMLLCAYLTKSTDQKSPKIVAQWKKIHALLSASEYASNILGLWQWAYKNKISISSTDQVTTGIAIRSLGQAAKLSSKDAKEAHQAFSLLKRDLESAENIKEAVSGMIQTLKSHGLYKELLEWLQVKQKRINSQKSVEERHEQTLSLMNFIKDLIVVIDDKKIMEDYFQFIQSNISENDESIKTVASIYLQILKNPILPSQYKEEKFRLLLNKKNEKVLEHLRLELQQDPNSSLEFLKEIAIDKNGKPFNEIYSIALQILSKADKGALLSWNPLIARLLTSSPNQNMKQQVQDTSEYILSMADPICDELIEGFIKQGIIIPTSIPKEVLTYIQTYIKSKTQNCTLSQSCELLESVTKQIHLMNDEDFKALFLGGIIMNSCFPEVKSKKKNLIAKLNHSIISLCGGKVIPDSLLDHLKKYMAVWGVEYHEEISQLAQELKIDQNVDASALGAYQETRQKSEANNEWDKLVANFSSLDLVSLKPLLAHIGPHKIKNLIEECLKKPEASKMISLLLLLEQYDKVSLKSWAEVFEAAVKLVDVTKIENQKLPETAWRIFWTKLRSKYTLDSEHPDRDIFILWGAATKFLQKTDSSCFLEFINDNSEYITLFSHASFPYDMLINEVPLVIKAVSRFIPQGSDVDYTLTLQKWNHIGEKYVSKLTERITTKEEEKLRNIVKEMRKAGISLFSRVADEKEFLSIKEFMQEEVSSHLSIEHQMDKADASILGWLEQLIAETKNERRLSIVRWGVEVISQKCNAHKAISLYLKLFYNENLDIVHQDFIDILLYLNLQFKSNHVYSLFINNMYVEIIRKIYSMPSNERSEEQSRLFLFSIDKYITRLSFKRGILDNPKSAYDWMEDQNITKLIPLNTNETQQMILKALFSFKGIQNSFFIRNINKREVSIPFISKYINNIEKIAERVSELTHQDALILLSAIYIYPIPAEYDDAPELQFPRKLAIQLSEQLQQRKDLEITPRVHFCLAHGLNRPELIPDTITDEDMRLGSMEILRNDLYDHIYSQNELEKIQYLLGLSTKSESIWDRYKDRQRQVMRMDEDEYISLAAEFLNTMSVVESTDLKTEEYYTLMLVEMVSLIKDNKRRFMNVYNILKRMKATNIPVKVKQLIFRAQEVYFEDRKLNEKRKYNEKGDFNMNTLSSMLFNV